MYVERLIKELKMQTYTNMEILLIDDGSTDDTVEKCQSYIEEDKRFAVFQKKNGGASSARNYGLRKAEGTFIAFVDVDDYIFPEYFEYLYRLLLKYDADLACCEYYKMWDTEKLPNFEKNGREIVFQTSEAMENLLYRKNLIGYPVLKLYRKDVLKNIFFPEDIIYGEDMIFTWNAIKQCKCVVYGAQVLYIYYQHSTSMTHSSTNVAQCKKAWDAHMKEILEDAAQRGEKIMDAARAKLFILAIDFACRIWKEPGTKDFRQELMEYISTADFAVLKDKDCKSMNRMLALLACMNASMMIRMCRLYLWIKRALRFETRRAV